jgi:hypothetical protein
MHQKLHGASSCPLWGRASALAVVSRPRFRRQTLLSRFPPMNFVKINKYFRECFYEPWAIGGTYPGKQSGGARLARWVAGAVGTDKPEVGSGCQLPSLTVHELVTQATQATAGGLCHFQEEALSWLACQTLRLPAGDSSISARITWRSSVAETTGKRMTSTHPRANRHCRDVNARLVRAPPAWRHKQ